MALGLHRLGLTPADFWALTPWELRVMAGQGGAQAPLSRAALEALVARFPDPAPAERRAAHTQKAKPSGQP